MKYNSELPKLSATAESSVWLKLRVFEDGSGELIHYERENSTGPKECRYVCSRTNDPMTLKETLAKSLGIHAVVRKKRSAHFYGQTRIHFDQVEGLGNFIELEVVLQPEQDIAHGAAIAEELMSRLNIEKEDLIPVAYVDLL